MLVVYPPKWSIILFSFGLCFLLILNIIAITTQANGEDFFALYFRKKNLEQKLRIRELEKKIDRNIR